MPDEQKPKETFGLPAQGEQDKPKLNFLQGLLNNGGKATDAPTNGNGNGNAFTKLFSQSGKQSVTEAPKLAPDVPSISSLLGAKPEFSEKFQEQDEKKLLKISKIACQIALLLAVGVFGFFYTQLNPNFTLFSDQLGPNVAMKFESSNTEIQSKQTELNLLRYNIARLFLDDIDGKIDSFLYASNVINSDISTSLEKQNAQKLFASSKEELKTAFKEAQKILVQPLGIDIFSKTPITPEERDQQYKILLKNRLVDSRTASAGNTVSDRENIRRIDNVIRLIDNGSLRTSIAGKDFGKISDEDLIALIKKIREEGTDELSLINKIKEKRINWSAVIRNLEAVTRKADLYYGQGLFKTVGGFLFSTYRFDSQTGRVSITGLTRTSDSKTFSFITKLVDSIEKSSSFKDIEYRSFTKSRDDKGDYSSSINFDFAIQNGTDPRDQ